MKKSGGFRNRILGAAAVLAVSATPVLAGLVSIPMPTDGDSYYIKGWKRPLVMAVPANLGHSTLDFVAKSLVRKTGTLILEARTLADKFLWEYDTKIPPELTEDQNGMHEPCVPWDLDGDGIDEVITMWFDMTTKPPTPYVVVLNGQTGKEKGKIKLPPGGGTSGGNTQNQPWGIGAHYCCIAYLDSAEGKPYFCISQGIYRDGAVWAFYWDSKTNNIALKWTYQYNSKVRDWGLGGTSTHGLTSYDTNGDGREEIVFGGTLLSADGVKLWSLCDTIGAGHVDGVTPGHLRASGHSA